MLYIGKNEDSDLLVGITESRKLFHISEYDKSMMSIAELQKASSERLCEDCEVLPNFTFTATLFPVKWEVTQSKWTSGIVFADANDPRIEYKMAQKQLMDLLQSIITGEVEVTSVGFYGLFTFDASHGKFVTIVYHGGGDAEG